MVSPCPPEIRLPKKETQWLQLGLIGSLMWGLPRARIFSLNLLFHHSPQIIHSNCRNHFLELHLHLKNNRYSYLQTIASKARAHLRPHATSCPPLAPQLHQQLDLPTISICCYTKSSVIKCKLSELLIRIILRTLIYRRSPKLNVCHAFRSLSPIPHKQLV